MKKPHLTFFCELDPQPLKKLFGDSTLLVKLKELDATISLGIKDFSPERTELAKTLNAAGIPVTAWLLLPKEQS